MQAEVRTQPEPKRKTRTFFPMSSRKKLIAGNWKMNKTSTDGVALARELVVAIGKQSDVDVVICPPFTAIESVGKALEGSNVKLGAQNMHHEASGAFTGEVSAPMLRAIFATHVILGHSERRTLFGETDDAVNKKVLAALKNQLRPIVCVGETLAERESASTLRVVQAQTERGLEGVSKEQAASLVIAYEPVWAIGTGKVATTEQAQEVHAFIRGLLANLFTEAIAQKIRILYGGSMKPANAPELLAQKDIDGGLIGGASLEGRSFLELVNAAAAVK
jgi:triosephosphate isomerase